MIVEWNGLLTPTETGDYNLGMRFEAGFARVFVDGKQAYVLENTQGRPLLYVTAQAGLNLEPYVNRNVELFGPAIYRGDLRANYMTVVRVAPLP